jgi:hypothetical protein
LSPNAFEINDIAGLAERSSVGVRVSATQLPMYDLVVLTRDVNDTVISAGGWLCDRARAGWRVTALAPPHADLRPLQILGLRTSSFDGENAFLRRSPPAAIAVAPDVLRANEALRDEILQIAEGGTTEVTCWGNAGSFGADIRFEQVAHRLSPAARAFKTHAAASASLPISSLGVTEEFCSYAMWYPPGGADLTPIG